MKLKLTQSVLDYEGEPLLVNKTNPDGSVKIGDDGRPVQEPETLRSYLVMLLNSKTKDETIDAEEAAKRYQLTIKLYARNDVDLGHGECTLLEERVKVIYADSSLLLGRLTDMLEGKKIEVPAK